MYQVPRILGAGTRGAGEAGKGGPAPGGWYLLGAWIMAYLLYLVYRTISLAGLEGRKVSNG